MAFDDIAGVFNKILGFFPGRTESIRNKIDRLEKEKKIIENTQKDLQNEKWNTERSEKCSILERKLIVINSQLSVERKKLENR